MTQPELSGDRWGGKYGSTRLVGRLVGAVVYAYAFLSRGIFDGPRWVAAVVAAGLVLTCALVLRRAFRPFDRLSIVLCVLLMVAGVVVSPATLYLASGFYVIGGIMLVGQPEIPVRHSLLITGVLGAVVVTIVLLTLPAWPVLLSNVFGVAVILLIGLNRRQRLIREQQDAALAARSAELEQRNAELEAQTERTRQETARAAALEERGRIARDLHDVLAHSLGGLVVQLEAAGAELERDRTTAAAERVRDARRLAVDGLREARQAVQELRGEPQSTTTDPVDAVRSVLQGPVGIALGAELEVVGRPREVPAATAEALAAVAREGLTNANKHAPSAPVSATLDFRPDVVRLELVNGRTDIDSPATPLAATGAGAGLLGLRERLAAVHGSLRAEPEGRRWVLAATCPTETRA